ncbi:MAG: cobalamin B12-binding domain-containing protein [Rhodospirillales bacterium]|nr:cobalamin B12-binding domain-containing protein [Rhodospirillales bacterium]
MEHRPKVSICVLGLDQHEVGALAAARMLRDAGMEVIYGGRFNLPDKIIVDALQDDVDLIGISCHSWEYREYIDDLLDGLKAQGMDVPVVLAGSILTAEDRDELMAKGVAEVFGASATPEHMVGTIDQLCQNGAA